MCKAKICSARTELWGKGLSWGFQVVRTLVQSAGWSYQQTANDLNTDEFTLRVLFWELMNNSKPEASSLNQGKETGKLRNLIPCKGRTPPHLLHCHGFLGSKWWHLTVKSGSLLVYFNVLIIKWQCMVFMQQLSESLQKTSEFQRHGHTVLTSPLFQTVHVSL